MPPSDTKVGPQSDGNVGVMLAHPLNPPDLIHLGLSPDTPAGVGDVIVVTKPNASSLIGAGLVQVDPEDNAAVLAVLEGEKQADVEPSSTSGNTPTVPTSADLKGDALDDALRTRGLPVEGKADDKRAAVAAWDAENGAPGTAPGEPPVN